MQTGAVRLVIRGSDLPGTSYGGRDPIGVALQVRAEPLGVVAGDAIAAAPAFSAKASGFAVNPLRIGRDQPSFSAAMASFSISARAPAKLAWSFVDKGGDGDSRRRCR